MCALLVRAGVTGYVWLRGPVPWSVYGSVLEECGIGHRGMERGGTQIGLYVR